MTTELTEQQVKQIILRELPAIVQSDVEVRNFILRLSREQFADKRETESRFDRVLEELRHDREENSRKWDDQNRKWDSIVQELKETRTAWDRKFEQTIGALGARWGIFSEQSFRNALKDILEKSFGVQVLNINEYDAQGEVFGRPDQVEIDLIIKNGTMIACEIKSSLSKADVNLFERKVRFYEKLQHRQATRLIVISPMIDKRASALAQQLGIQVFHGEYDLDEKAFEK